MSVSICDVTKNENGDYQATAIGLQKGDNTDTINNATKIGQQTRQDT